MNQYNYRHFRAGGNDGVVIVFFRVKKVLNVY